VKAKFQDPKVAIGAAVAAGLLLTLAGWFLLVSPARSKADELQTSIDSTQSEISARRAALAAKPKIRVDVRSSDLFRLTKAVPDHADMTGLVLQLTRLSKGTGVSFQSVTPSPQVVGLGYNVQPLSVVVQGRFGEVNDFLHRLRKLVTVRKAKLDARGRLFAIDNVALREASKLKFPSVEATITLDAFVYAGGAPPAAANGTSSPSSDNDDSSTPSPSGAVAAGATP
jgi:Tfp pilus assembly protein PilO